MVVAESQLADRVFTAPYDEAAFTDVIKKSVNGVAQFGEGIVNGRRCAVTHENKSAIVSQPVAGSNTCISSPRSCRLPVSPRAAAKLDVITIVAGHCGHYTGSTRADFLQCDVVSLSSGGRIVTLAEHRRRCSA